MFQKAFWTKAVFVALLAGISAAGAYAQITISGGFALGRVDANGLGVHLEGSTGLGANIYLDYLLPINIPLSLGGEIGVDTSSLSGEGDTMTAMAVPILLRAAYHFDLLPKLDLYAVGKLGYAIGFVTAGTVQQNFDSAGGFATGIDVGVAYYFASAFGAFIEVGFDNYRIESKFSSGIYSQTIDTPFSRFFTVGLSFKR
jgi:hypothetical protein